MEITLSQLCKLSEILHVAVSELLSSPSSAAEMSTEERVAAAQANHPDPTMAARARLLGDEY
ncbi:hypothetical protein SAMN05216548_1322 [Faunimonas pinastri]|uniref:Uncharacterized protein n=1 Tax=Faunimonas pinastri TaxID=1855383 RepID=A0A1H9QPU8_9HYPH|nr:hypothetical protein SAMN05216548_1322 [Faunimonas pinastri]